MIDEIRKIPVFIARDFRILFTYKLAFSMSFFNVFFTLIYFVLFGSMFGQMQVSSLDAYGGDFIYYILVGSIGWGFMWTVMAVTSSSLSVEMSLGTLESILLTPTKVITMMISYSLFGSFFGLVTIVTVLGLGFFLFGITVFANATIFTLLFFILSLFMMAGFGLIFGGITIWLKNIGDTVPIIQSVAMIFCGVYFPIAVLPSFVQPIRHIMPFYYSMEGLRKSLIPTTPTSEIYFYLGVLAAFTIIFIVLGVIILNIGFTKARKDGSLMFY